MNSNKKIKIVVDISIKMCGRSLSSFVKNPNMDFIRKRKLDFQKMMQLIISMESDSLNHELLKFFDYDSSVPTGSAFYQQRSKLSISAFRHLLKEFNLKFPLDKFRGKYYLIACDGSEFNIARNPNDSETFHEPNGKSASGFNMVHTISLYELCSKRYLDLEVQPGRLKMSFRLFAILWFGMPMEVCRFSSLTEDFPATTFLPMQSKIKLIF